MPFKIKLKYSWPRAETGNGTTNLGAGPAAVGTRTELLSTPTSNPCHGPGLMPPGKSRGTMLNTEKHPFNLESAAKELNRNAKKRDEE